MIRLLSFAIISVCISTNVFAANVEQPQGTFTVEKEVSYFDKGRFKAGCSYNGYPYGKAQVDKRLKAGMTYVQDNVSVNGNGPVRTYSIKTGISKIDGLIVTATEKVIAQNNVTGLPQNFQTARSCELYDGEYICRYRPVYPKFDATSGEYEDCSAGGSSNDLPKVYLGKFKFLNGKTVTAYKTVMQFDGGLACGMQNLGNVSNTLVEIYTNDVPAQSTANFCGGYNIFLGFVVKKPDGKIVVGNTTEYTSVP
ncbi:MAG: hypothetical protein SGI74_10700 [Oligoflexia bacterium]|nr:hypothetical protein [Oligoflexia bacterium]